MIDEYLAVDVLRGHWPGDNVGDRFAVVATDLGITITVLAI